MEREGGGGGSRQGREEWEGGREEGEGGREEGEGGVGGREGGGGGSLRVLTNLLPDNLTLTRRRTQQLHSFTEFPRQLAFLRKVS